MYFSLGTQIPGPFPHTQVHAPSLSHPWQPPSSAASSQQGLLAPQGRDVFPVTLPPVPQALLNPGHKIWTRKQPLSLLNATQKALFCATLNQVTVAHTLPSPVLCSQGTNHSPVQTNQTPLRDRPSQRASPGCFCHLPAGRAAPEVHGPDKQFPFPHPCYPAAYLHLCPAPYTELKPDTYTHTLKPSET